MHTTLTMTPGAIIGYRKDGRPIRPIAGGSEGAPEAPPAPTPPAPAPPTPTPAPPAAEPPAPQPPTPPQPQAASVEELPAWAQKSLTELRAEAAANRVKAKEVADNLAAFQAEQVKQRDAFAKALGLAGEEPPTAEQLTEQLTASKAERDAERQRARAAAVELAVFRAAAAAQVDGNALLDSRAFANTLDGLDPAATDFGQKVTDAISAAAEQNPGYKLAPSTPAPPAPPLPPTVPKSGAEFGAPPTGPRQWTDADVEGATPRQVQDAINAGLLQNLGFGPKRGARR
jgi:hypothetical protein